MSLLNIIAVLSNSGTISGTTGTLINAVSPDDYGAVGNGTSDDTAALAAAIATGYHVFIPKNKTYKVVGTTGNGSSTFAALVLGTGQKIIGEDRYTSKIKCTGNARAIQLGNNSAVHNLTFVGNGIGSGQAFNAGVVPYNIGCIVDSCDFTDFSGTDSSNGGGGVFCIGNTSASPDFKDGYLITNSDFYSNVCGLNLIDRAEYVTVQGGRYLRNTTGIAMYSGNNSMLGLNVMGNGTGIKIRTGSNDGHSTFTGCRFNHNTTLNIDVNGITLGLTFSGCHSYGGSMSVASSTGIKFVGCDLVGGSSAAFTATSSTILIDGCRYPKSPTSTALVLTNSGSTITEGTNLNF